MFIRDTVPAQERLCGLQPKCIKNGLFNRRKMATKNKKHKKYAENTKLFLQNRVNNLRGTDSVTCTIINSIQKKDAECHKRSVYVYSKI